MNHFNYSVSEYIIPNCNFSEESPTSMSLFICVCVKREDTEDERYSVIGEMFLVQARDKTKASNIAVASVVGAEATREEFDQGLADILVRPF